MNKNPFVPQQSYQPPLPPGPPPPQPGQSDYAAYWAGGSQPPQPPPAGQFNPAWTSPPAQLPARPAPEQAALYANYGYSAQWQRQQQQQQLQQMQAQYHNTPPPPPVAHPPAPAQPAYNPYQPAAGYPQQYAPPPPPPIQAAPQSMPPVYHQAPPAQQPYYPQQQQPPQQPMQQQQQQQQRHNMHHTPPQHLPPAKRQRFEGPNQNRMQHHPPPQPQFQAPPPPPQNINLSFTGGSGQRGGAAGMSHMGAGRGGSQVGRGGGTGGGRGGRGVSASGSRGNMAGGRGRGGSFSAGGGMGGARGGGSSGSLRAHGSRSNFGNQNRRGGGYGGGSGYQSGSFRGGRGGHSGPGRTGRHDGSGAGVKDGQASAGFGGGGKKEENRRTLTDFKIIGLEIKDLAWTWGVLPAAAAAATIAPVDEDADKPMDNDPQEASAQEGPKDESKQPHSPLPESRELSPAHDETQELEFDVQQTQIDESLVPVGDSQMTVVDGSQATTVPATQTQDILSSLASVSTTAAPPPARLRIYFHTPVNADDSRPIPHSSSMLASLTTDSTRKGKRKKLEDDDGDIEEERARPPPPQMHSQAQSIISDDRSDVAPSATSEGDWLMAAIAENEEEEDHGQSEVQGEHDQEEEEDVSQLVFPAEQEEPVNDELTQSATSGGVKVNDTVDTGDDNKGTNNVNMVMEHEQPSDLVSVSSAPQSEPASSEVKDIDGVVGTHISSTAKEPNSATSLTASDSIAPTAPEAPSTSDSTASSERSSVSAVDPSNAIAISDSQITIKGSQVMGLAQSLLGASQPTLLNIDQPIKENGSVSPRVAPSDDGSVTVTNGPTVDQDHMDDQEQTQMSDLHEMDHLPEPPASPPGSNTFLSNSSTSTYGGSPVASVAKGETKLGGKTPSANRLSISFAGGGRRLVIDAEVVESMKVHRQQGRIEVLLNIVKEEEDGLKGILLEHLSDVTKSYLPLENALDHSGSDTTLPPFSKVPLPATIALQVYLDKEKPLSEPKWVKTGDIQEWMRTMFGRMFWVAGDAADGWEKKIQVVDPDPPPTIWTVLEGWASNSPAGAPTERHRFLKTHMTEIENVLEVLLRLVRGERATASYQSTPSIPMSGVSGPLLAAVQGSDHGSQQTHVSLAVLAMFRMAVEYAEKALGTEEGKKEAEERVGEIIRCLPSHLIYKSLDGIFKEWRVEKKGR